MCCDTVEIKNNNLLNYQKDYCTMVHRLRMAGAEAICRIIISLYSNPKAFVWFAKADLNPTEHT